MRSGGAMSNEGCGGPARLGSSGLKRVAGAGG